MDLAAAFHRAVAAAGVPLVGVSIGLPNDRRTWRIHYAANATAQHVATGEALILSFDPADPVVVARERAEDAKELEQKRLQAVALATHQRFKASVPGDTVTLAQWRAAIRAAWDSLP